MRSISRILVPIDFSRRSGEAARYARLLAEQFLAELLFVHVVDGNPFAFAMVEPSGVSLEHAAEGRRTEAQKALCAFLQAELGGHTVHSLVAEGKPAEQILHVLQAKRADMIVMPTQGHNRIRQFLIGSITAKVLHDSPAPVWTGVHLEESRTFPDIHLRRILCAVDFGPQSTAVLTWGAELASAFGAPVSAIHVMPDPTAWTDDGRDQAAQALRVEGMRERLREAMRPLGLTGDASIEYGEPHKVVTAAAARSGVDLLIIGRGCSDNMLGRLKAQAYAIVRQSPCPVLSV
ncbi:MAG TPA: universal stress protein [Bryobacteraceae bacterium]|nr:universal stress protein [Bryobacteraceae bacterium]